MDPGLTLVKHSFDTPSVEHRFERLLRRGTIMEHEGEPRAKVGGAARRHGQHHGVDPGPRGRRTRVPVLRPAGAGVQAAGPGLARDAQAVVVVPAVRDHLGGLTRREARGWGETAAPWPVTRPGPAPGPLVARVDAEPPARSGPNAASPAPQPRRQEPA